VHQSRAGLCEEKNLAMQGIEPGHPAHSPSLYRLSYPGSIRCDTRRSNFDVLILVKSVTSITVDNRGFCNINIRQGSGI
jgi:hypothetical protein